MECPKCHRSDSMRAQVLTWRVLSATGKLGPLVNRTHTLGVGGSVPVYCTHCDFRGIADDLEEAGGIYR
jgi:hypothetical protein